MNIQVIVAAHKAYRMPEDKMYCPVQVGHALASADLGWQADDDGENISAKNPHFCELTGLYWAWKHLDADALGLVHYRRHFLSTSLGVLERVCLQLGGAYNEKKWDSILTGEEAAALLAQYPVLLPYKRHYYIETIESQYAHAHHAEDLKALRTVLTELCPDYLPAYDTCLQRRSLHLFNMFLMRKEYFQEYCSWLFAVLFALEERLDISAYSRNDARVFGFLGERLLDVWLEKNQVAFAELPVLFFEERNLFKKYTNFVLRKINKNLQIR